MQRAEPGAFEMSRDASSDPGGGMESVNFLHLNLEKKGCNFRTGNILENFKTKIGEIFLPS